jgi:hypothetical protein
MVVSLVRSRMAAEVAVVRVGPDTHMQIVVRLLVGDQLFDFPTEQKLSPQAVVAVVAGKATVEPVVEQQDFHRAMQVAEHKALVAQLQMR